MSGKSHEWAALESQHERLVDLSGPLLLGDDAPRRGRKLWHRRATAVALGTAGAVPQPRHPRRRAAAPRRPDA
jgi:hypothetical protein